MDTVLFLGALLVGTGLIFGTPSYYRYRRTIRALKSGTTVPGFQPDTVILFPTYAIASDGSRMLIADRIKEAVTPRLTVAKSTILSVALDPNPHSGTGVDEPERVELHLADGTIEVVQTGRGMGKHMKAQIERVVGLEPSPVDDGKLAPTVLGDGPCPVQPLSGAWETFSFETRGECRYLGGFAEFTEKAPVANRWLIQVTEQGIWLGQGQFTGVVSALASLPTGGYRDIRKSLWDDIAFVWIADEGVKRLNAAAIATVGILALGARRDSSSLAVGFTEGETAFFESRKSLMAWRADLAPLLQKNPHLLKKVQLNTSYPSEFTAADTRNAESDLRQLESLLRGGLISQSEYEAKRQAVIDRL